MMSLLLPAEIMNLLNRASWKQGSDLLNRGRQTLSCHRTSCGVINKRSWGCGMTAGVFFFLFSLVVS